ncbi:unnamed protein product [Mytilus edulis]|uniref:Uncharacterized protein n=1 Tax=Mytilus edulis TaxID=6550 RepID=A0A8S3SDQ5_MYTED|nr:unnamed protein product [Mytilus edulis]
MSDLKGILLLFSSGVPSTNRFHRNDGSISGLIFLVAFLSFSCCAVFVSSYRGRNVTASMTPPGSAYLIILCALAFLASMVIVYINAKRITRNGSDTLYKRDNTAWLKLKFLYLFGVGGIAYQIIAYIYRRECSPPHVDLDNILAAHIALILFFLTQTAFIRIMHKFVLTNSIVIFYTVSFILVTNVAVWTYYTVTGYYITREYYSEPNISDCNCNSTFISKVYWRSRVIVDPMIMEYALLASIFVLGMWPLNLQKEQCDGQNTERNIEELNDRSEICNINVCDQITETSPLIQSKSEKTKYCFKDCSYDMIEEFN